MTQGDLHPHQAPGAAELSPNGAGLRLLQNSVATAAALIAIIIALFPISGAQINPAVTLANWLLTRSGGRLAIGYVIAQCMEAFAGCVLANVMFGEPAITIARAVTGSFAGIAPASVPGFLLGQILGAVAAVAVVGFLLPRTTPIKDRPST